MKKILLTLCLALLFLSACTIGKSPTTSVDDIKTAIYLTATAQQASTTQKPPTATSKPATATPTAVPATETQTVTPPPSPTAPPLVTLPTAVPGWNPYYADQFIYYYFQHINNRDYATTWSLLTADFIAANNSPAQGGYTSYVNFWNTVQWVTVNYVTLTSFNGYYANVIVDMVFTYFNGTVTSVSQPFYLAYNVSRGTWMFDTYTYVAPVSSSTPDQFIYNYFSNINARNYGLTWSLLSASFIAANNSGGYSEYVSYWNTVSYVTVNYVTVNSQTASTAEVTASLTFHKTDSTVVTLSIPYHLIYNNSLTSWQFYTP